MGTALHPSLDRPVPDAAGGCGFGCGPLLLGIAGVRIRLTGEDPDLRLAPDPTTAAFTLAGGPADVELRVSAAELDPRPPGELLFDSGSLWRLYRSGDEQVYRFTSPLWGPAPYKEARLRPDFRSGEIRIQRRWLRGQPVYPLRYPLDELLMMRLLAQGLGVEVHACGVRDQDGSGYLFVGQSGAGKTTTARLWAAEDGVTVLSDDRIILRPGPDGVTMHGTPWHGESQHAFPGSATLRGIFLLGKSHRNEFTPLPPAAAVARLLACGFPPFHHAQGLDATLTSLAQVLERVPCRIFHFFPEAAAVAAVRSHLN